MARETISILDAPDIPKVEVKFWTRVSPPWRVDGCWVWTGNRCGKDARYGTLYMYRGYAKNGSRKAFNALAHRISYELRNGRIPEGLEIDHLCKNTLCVNPAHLEAVTHTVNVQRGDSWTRAKTHCPKGHRYDRVDTWTSRKTGEVHTARRCQQCRKEQGYGHPKG